ncbi:MAG: ATP-binding cassette domain-containing protein [Oscillospiraceae bacterium]|nr:ATP-binding cassette domain-containing protein [Oscillospiraceae bacterium]
MRICVENLSFRYPNAVGTALSGVTFTLEEGSFTTLCGTSGCGKSTLLRMLKPCLRPHGELSGEIAPALSDKDAARDIGFVMQDPEAQICTDRVWHELAFSLESVGEEPDKMRRRVAECAEYFGLESVFERETAALSGGEKQLLALASAAALRPRLLLLDEPTSQLDPVSARGFFDIVTRLNRELGVTVLVAEHRLEELLPVSDHVLVMDGGRLIADCKPRELLGALPVGHPMRGALPAAMRIFACSEEQGEPLQDGSLRGEPPRGEPLQGVSLRGEPPRGEPPRDVPPLSVREGRQCAAVIDYLRAHKPPARPSRDISSKPVLTVKELCVSYGRRLPDALKSVSLSVRGGELYALLGGNGSGKSTLLKAVFGIVKPLGGRITRCGKIAYLPQNPCEILGADTVREEVPDEKMLEKFGLTELSERDPLDLSGGERQRLALAKLLLSEPELLLLDEPTKGMDALAKAEFAELLRGLTGTAVLLVTHDAEFAAKCADICGLLFNGEVVSEGEPAAFFGDNYFYTTPLCRLAKGITEGYV